MRKKQNRVAQQHVNAINAELARMDAVEAQLEALQTEPGSAEEARKTRLLLAIQAKGLSLARQLASLQAYLASEDDAERVRLAREYKDEKTAFAADDSFSDKVAGICVPCQFGLGCYRSRSKTVWAQIAEVSFDGDHKLLKPNPAENMDDQPSPPFKAPHWVRAVGQPDRDYPVSYTKKDPIKVTAKFSFSVTSEPEGQTASWSKVRGITEVQMVSSGRWYQAKKLVFEGAPATGAVKTGLYSTAQMTSGRLWDIVWGYQLRIHWYVRTEGKWLKAGDSTHGVYVTANVPGGQMECPSKNRFQSSGPMQDVTEERLQLAVAAVGRYYQDQRSYCDTELKCANAVFWDLKARGVGYSLGHRWIKNAVENLTGIEPYPTLHHYLWRSNAATAEGECHNIAAGFILMCQILGVKGPMEVGYMKPRAGRSDVPPGYPWSGGDVGAWNTTYSRVHQLAGHGPESIVFLDANRFANNFEGATKYAGKYYAIGEEIYDSPSHFYGSYDAGEARWKGSFGLFFPGCSTPYPNRWRVMTREKPGTGEEFKVAGFYWHWGSH